MSEIQTSLQTQSKSTFEALQELENTPFLERPLYPLSQQREHFTKLEQVNQDPVRAKRIKRFKTEYLKEIEHYNQAMRMRDKKAENLAKHYQNTEDRILRKTYRAQYDSVCKRMNELWLDLSDWFYKRQKLENEVFKTK